MSKIKHLRYSHSSHHERWLISYADFITLLFAFFVTFYSVSAVDSAKYDQLRSSFKKAFNASAKPGDVDDESSASMKSQNVSHKKNEKGWESVSFELLGKKIDITFDELVKQGLVTIKKDPSFIEVGINSSFLFGTGEADLRPDAQSIVGKLAKIFTQTPGSSIYVEGFTDNTPIKTANFPSNWELSSARASAVIRLLASEGVNPSLMTSIGYGEYHPVASNESEKDRSKNRRVVILISRYIYDKDQASQLQNRQELYLEHKNVSRKVMSN